MTLKKKIIISITFFLILSLLLAAFIILPIFSGIKEISRDIPFKKQEQAELEKKLENLDKFKKILPGISADFGKIDRLFINLEIPIDFIRFLEKIAQDSKTSLKISLDSSSSRTIDTDFWPSITFRLNLAGPYSNFSNFLEKLESGPYLIEIQNLNITNELKPLEFKQFYLDDIKADLLIKVYAK